MFYQVGSRHSIFRGFHSGQPRFVIALSRCNVIAALLTSSLLAIACNGRPMPPEGAKNVVILTLDDLRQDHVSAFGYEREATPL
jgi:hypothetical protein